MPELEIRDEPARRLLGVAHLGPYAEIGQAFARLGEIAREAGVSGAMAGSITTTRSRSRRPTCARSRGWWWARTIRR